MHSGWNGNSFQSILIPFDFSNNGSVNFFKMYRFVTRIPRTICYRLRFEFAIKWLRSGKIRLNKFIFLHLPCIFIKLLVGSQPTNLTNNFPVYSIYCWKWHSDFIFNHLRSILHRMQNFSSFWCKAEFRPIKCAKICNYNSFKIR